MGVLANPDSNQAMVPSKQKRTHAVFCVSSAHRLAPTSKPRFVGERVKLGELGKTQSGGTPSSKHPEFFSGSIPWIGTTALNGKLLDESNAVKMITAEAVEKSATKIVPAGSIMVGIRVGVGKVAINSVPMCTSQDIISIIGIDEGRWNKEYISLALQYKAPILASQAQGATITGITSKTLKSIAIPVLPLAAQNAIVSQLRSIEQQIACMTVMLSQLDSLVKSRFVEMFESKDYGMRPMGDLVESITAGTNVGGQQRPLGEGEYGVLKISAVTQGVFNPGEFKVVNDVSHIKMIHPRKGDLLFSRANTSEMVGATAIVDKDYGDLFLPDKLWRLDPTDEVETVFLKALLSSPSIRAEMSKVSTGSSGSMQNISMAKFRKLPAFLPPLALQQEFAAFASQVDKSRFIAQQQIEKLQMLYNSLAQDYFGD